MTNEEWLKDQCNRYVNGICDLRRCLVRGGYKEGPIGPDKYNFLATCHAHEVLPTINPTTYDRKTQDLPQAQDFPSGFQRRTKGCPLGPVAGKNSVDPSGLLLLREHENEGRRQR